MSRTLFENIFEGKQDSFEKTEKTPRQIIESAVEKYRPVKILLLFSGGYDSLVCSHVCAKILSDLGLSFTVYHGDTTIGIPETQQFVRDVCKQYGWDLVIKQPPNRKDWYDKIVERWGFPGPTRDSHQMCYNRLKERALNRYVSHECKSSVYARENVLLLTGVRKSESRVRMSYTDETRKESSKIWCNPIFWWDAAKCLEYRRNHDMPTNEVKEKLCISGECMCGAFADNGEYEDLKKFYPETAKEIEKLHELAKENGHPWPWSMGPTTWFKNHPKGQTDMFMCVGCEDKRKYKEA